MVRKKNKQKCTTDRILQNTMKSGKVMGKLKLTLIRKHLWRRGDDMNWKAIGKTARIEN